MAEQLAELNKDTSGTWEEVQITKLDTSHPYVAGQCYKNTFLKLAFFTGTVYDNTNAFSGLPKPFGNDNVRACATDSTNKANVGYIQQDGVLRIAGGTDPSYYNMTVIYPI